MTVQQLFEPTVADIFQAHNEEIITLNEARVLLGFDAPPKSVNQPPSVFDKWYAVWRVGDAAEQLGWSGPYNRKQYALDAFPEARVVNLADVTRSA